MVFELFRDFGLGNFFPGVFTGAMLGLIILTGLAVYIYTAIALMTIAKKTKTRNPWLAWIPIANFYLLTQIAKQNGWWTLILLATLVPFGNLAVAGISVWLFWIIAEKRKFPGWISLLMLVPILNLVILGIIAWAK